MGSTGWTKFLESVGVPQFSLLATCFLSLGARAPRHVDAPAARRMSHSRMRFVPEADVRYSGIGEDEDGEPSDLGEEDGEPIDLGAGSPHITAQPSMLFLLSINSFGFSYGMTVSTLGLVILPSEAMYLYHDRCVCVWRPLCRVHTTPPRPRA